ncbi:MAG: NAD(P)/FAD-dependent oxidoreductase [Anaerolineaceae bacterium]|nr:NAD(P)/FAD-dependent oxidoreductase [Anaerolineaceae bacterium]
MKIAIVGAGFGGMSAALDLVKAGNQVTIFEGSDHPGGLASGFKKPEWDWPLEKFYHHWFTSDKEMFKLFEELGLTSKVIIRTPKTVMFYKNKFYPFDSIPAAILYPGLGWGINKIRFGLVGVYLRLTNNWKPMEKTTVDAWMRKWAGDKVYTEMWQPMLIGKFGERFAPQVNMAWMWARMHARTTSLATYEGGFQQFAQDFAEALKKKGVDIRYNTRIDHIERVEESVELTLAESKEAFDQVLVTISPAALAKMAPALGEEYLKGLLELKNLGAVVMVVSLKHQLSREGYYWYNLPKKEGYPFLALVEHTNFMDKEHYNNEHLIYCGDYLENGHEYFSMSKEELVERFLPTFKKINPDFDPDWVNETWLFRESYAQPVPFVNHSRNIPTLQTPIEGLYFASMSQVYPWDRGTNFAVEIGRRAARLMQVKIG